eukprot:2317324-Prymnesium_polylepis.1
MVSEDAVAHTILKIPEITDEATPPINRAPVGDGGGNQKLSRRQLDSNTRGKKLVMLARNKERKR